MTGTRRRIKNGIDLQIEAALRIQDDIAALQAEQKQEAEDDTRKKSKSFREYAEQYLKIRDKDKRVVPFKFNKAQEVLEEVTAWMRKRGYLERYLMLKARQKGASTYWEGDIFHRTAEGINSKAAIVGHEMASSNNLFDMTKRFYNNLPERMKPETAHTSGKLLKFRKLDSEIKVMTAGLKGSNVGVSDTIHYLHCTEVSRWNKQKETMSALFQTVPDNKESLIVIETTAHGIGDEYYNMWQAVYTDPEREVIIPNVAWKSPSSAYAIIFISWLIDDEYTLPFKNAKEKKLFRSSMNELEKTLQKRGARLEHLKWRRFNIKDKQTGDESLFAQDYPSTPEEAFLVTGRPVFNADICYSRYQEAEDNVFLQGDLIPVYDGSAEYEKQLNSSRCSFYDLLPWLRGVEWRESKTGYIKIYDTIEISEKDRYRFATGWDVAEGLAQGDFTTGAYLDRKFMRMVLRWHGHIDPDLVAEEQYKISLFLKRKDYICTERNNHGLTTITGARNLGLRQYYQEEFGKGYIEGSDRLGFKTDGDNKRIIIDDLNEYIRDAVYDDPEVEFWGETLTYVKDKKGRMNAQGKSEDPGVKCYDDRVMSRALMVRCHKWMPKWLTEEDKRERKERAVVKKRKIQMRKRVRSISSF